MVTRAIILAAGLGTRLGSLSDERPKPLLPVCDVPLIRYAVALLRGAGIDEIAVNLHHRGELIRAELGDGFLYSEEPTILGTGGGIEKLDDWLTRGGRDSFVVVNGKLVERHRRRKRRCVTMTQPTPPPPWSCARCPTRRSGAPSTSTTTAASPRIIGQGRPGAHACMFTGVHVLSPRLIARLPATGESDSIRQALHSRAPRRRAHRSASATPATGTSTRPPSATCRATGTCSLVPSR